MQITSMRLPPLPARKTEKALLLIRQAISSTPRRDNSKECKAKQQHDSSLFRKFSNSREKSAESLRARSSKSNQSVKSNANSCQSLDNHQILQLKNKSSLLSSSLPEITAKSWILYEMRENKCLYAKRNYKKREIASLTKMMNLIVILELIKQFKIDPKKVKICATNGACSMTGTTAELKLGALYTLQDLYFGMMLPSGNDSAYLIAQFGGFLIKMIRQNKADSLMVQNAKQLAAQFENGGPYYVCKYLKQMNRLARLIGMNSSNFANPHGLSNKSNFSSASDVAKLCSYAMKNGNFRDIVATQQHNYVYQFENLKEDKENIKFNQSVQDRKQSKEHNNVRNVGLWQNTNKMLEEGWNGIKTGITPNAGPCLAASTLRTIKGQQYEFLVVLLNSQSMEARWQEARNLVNWAIQNKIYI